ncbi:hypothetical protein D3C73_1318630 [compost metagenome]
MILPLPMNFQITTRAALTLKTSLEQHALGGFIMQKCAGLKTMQSQGLEAILNNKLQGGCHMAFSSVILINEVANISILGNAPDNIGYVNLPYQSLLL